MNKKNMQEFILDLEKAGICTKKVNSRTIDLSKSRKKELVISGNDYNLDGVIFKIGDNFIINIEDYEGCEVHCGDNCKITMQVGEGVVRAGNFCEICSNVSLRIHVKNQNKIYCVEESVIEMGDNNEVTTNNSYVNIKGGEKNDIIIGTEYEWINYGDFHIKLGKGSQIYIGGSTTIEIG